MLVYIAGALSTSIIEPYRTPSKVVTDYIQNIHKMCEVAARLRKKGYYPYVPGLDFLLGVVSGNLEEQDYRDIGMKFLEVCDAVLVISDSYGVRKEIERATEVHIPVFYNEEALEKSTHAGQGIG